MGEVVERARLQPQRLVEGQVEGARHHLLREALRERRAARQESGESQGLRQQVGGGDDAVHQADAQRMRGVDAPAREDELHGVAETHDAREPHAAAVAGVEAPVHVLMGEFGVGRTEAQVAGLRELQPARDRVAVDRRHDRLVDGEAAGDAAEARPFREAPAEFGRRAPGVVHGVGLEVGAGAEGLVASPGEHGDPRRVVRREFPPARDQPVVGREIERVHLVRPVDGDQAHGTLRLVADVAHRSSPSRLRAAPLSAAATSIRLAMLCTGRKSSICGRIARTPPASGLNPS